jgi:predicted CxxxxCH...CXXCH cytochrome family protein
VHTNVNCGLCHTGATTTTYASANHFDGNIDVAVGPTNITKHAAGSGYSSCSNITCHNGPASNPFTAPAATWGATLDCAGCHAYPPANTNHTGVNPATVGVCNDCHNNVVATTSLTTPSQSAFTSIQEHMNGTVEGGKCDSCHGYPPVKSLTNANGPVGYNANYSSARMQNYSGGGGVHDVAGHLAPTLKASQGIRQAKIDACKNCHGDTFASGQHNQASAGFSNFSTKFVQVVVDANFKFDKNRPIVYNGTRLVSGSKTTGTCSNVSCHFQKSPVWSSTPYGQGH